MIAAIIPAAGSGSRMGTNIPKQFLELNGVPILVQLELFVRCGRLSNRTQLGITRTAVGLSTEVPSGTKHGLANSLALYHRAVDRKCHGIATRTLLMPLSSP